MGSGEGKGDNFYMQRPVKDVSCSRVSVLKSVRSNET